MKGDWMMWLAVGIGYGSLLVDAGYPLILPFGIVIYLGVMSALAYEVQRRYGPQDRRPYE